MLKQDIPMRRFAVTLEMETFDRLNKYIGAMRVKVPLYQALTKQLIKVMDNLQPMDRRIFIASIIAGDVTLLDWIKEVKDKDETSEPKENINQSL
jgi:hypothetical protein